jgi:hypothetical protein
MTGPRRKMQLGSRIERLAGRKMRVRQCPPGTTGADAGVPLGRKNMAMAMIA